jgi:hypothetical protein
VTAGTPKPLVATLLEMVAEAMELSEGHKHLDLYFDDGKLRSWATRSEKNGIYALVRYDPALDVRRILPPHFITE